MPEWSRIARRIRVPLGFVFALVYFWLARPSWRSIAVGAVLVLPGLWIRALASGHVRKNEALATSGPYAYTRNPLYLGSLLIGVGFAMAARSWWIGLLLLVMFFAIYIPVIRGEEELLRQKFPEFDEYVRQGHLDCLGRSPDPSTLAELPLSGQQDSGVRRGLARLQRGNSDHSTTPRRDYGKTDRGCKLIWDDRSFLSCT